MGDPFFVNQSASVMPGQAATCRVDGETFDGPDVTPDPSRQISPDATGRYLLHSDSSDTNPPLSLQLNQAGWALVGWMASTAGFVQQKADVPGGNPIGVLVADLDPGAMEALPNVSGVDGQKKGSRFVFMDVDAIEGHDPDELLDPEDPFVRGTPLNSGGLPGTFTGWIAFDVIADAESDEWHEIVPQLRATVVLTRHQNNATKLQTLVFDMVDPEARVSERTIADQTSPLLQQYLIATNRRLVPPSFFDTSSPSGAMWAAAIALFEENGVLETQILEYAKVVDEPTIAHRGPIVAKIQGAIGAAVGLWQGTEYAPLLNAKLLRAADRTLVVHDFGNSSWFTQLLTKVGMQLPISQWVAAIGSMEKMWIDLASSPDAAPAPGAVESLQVAPDELLWLSNSKSFGLYRYTFKFGPPELTDVEALKKLLSKLPKWAQEHIPKVPNSKGTKVGEFVQVIIAVFKMTVSAEESFQLGVGAIKRDHYTKLWGEKTFFCVTYEVGAGVGSIPGLPPEMKIDSAFKVSPDAFADALFEVKGAGVEAGLDIPGMKGLKGGASVRRMTFTLQDGMVLEGDLPEGNFVPKPVFSPSLKDIKKVQELIKARSTKEFFEKIFSAGGGVEFMAGAVVAGNPSPEHWVTPAKQRIVDGRNSRTVASFFKLDSVDINAPLNGWSRRFLLESLLAVDLYLFNGAPFFSVIGHASPEGTRRHNLILSRQRAAAVRQAILDAVVIDPALVKAVGSGDELAMRTPVDASLDPSDPKNKGAKTFDEPDPDGDIQKKKIFENAHSEQSDQWWKFRKVEIWWWGHFFATVQTTGSESDEDQPADDSTDPQEAPPDTSDDTSSVA